MNKEELIKNISDFRKNTIKMVKEGKMTADEAYMTVDELSDAVYKINQEDCGNLHIDMSLTAPGCPVAGILPQQVADATAGVPGVGKVEVEVVWEPAWTLERLSDDARMMLEMI